MASPRDLTDAQWAILDPLIPDHFDVHLALDNYGTHKTPLLHRWLVKRPPKEAR